MTAREIIEEAQLSIGDSRRHIALNLPISLYCSNPYEIVDSWFSNVSVPETYQIGTDLIGALYAVTPVG